jgi:two-component system sensor histidine kinase KdpD
VHVQASDGLASGSTELIEAHQRLLADLGGEYHEVVGTDVAKALTQFARAENATQLVLGATRRNRWTELTRGSIINSVLREAGTIDVHVIREEAPEGEARVVPEPMSLVRRRRRPRLSTRRQLAGGLIALVGIPLLTLLLVPLRDHVNLSTDMLLFLVLVVVVAVVGGLWPALVAAVVASLVVNWYFTEPLYTFTIAEGQNLVALATFLAVAVIVSTLVTKLARRSADSVHARAEAEALARVAGGLAGDDDAVDEMLLHLRTTFELDAVSLLVPDDSSGRAGRWRVEAHAGEPAPTQPAGHQALGLVGGAVVAYDGPILTVDDERVLRVFGAQLSSALERRRLRAEAAEAEALAEADELRTAILRAVSHDLRTPLASIKASATSLLQDDVDWTPEARQVFLATIEEEADRLNMLVGNLLDMSRLESGALDVVLRPVALEEVVERALASLSGPIGPVDVQVSEQLPPVVADSGLLERVVANLLSNALRYSPGDTPVRIEAGKVGDHVHLRIIDQGPGVRPADRDRIFEPFQRLGDRGTATGVGLGLAVARGFTDAMDGELSLEDTPGGGLTTVVALRVAGDVSTAPPPAEPSDVAPPPAPAPAPAASTTTVAARGLAR